MTAPSHLALDRGTAGASSLAEYERRTAKHEQRIEQRWGTGRLGRFVKFVSDEPQSTKAWAQGSDGERRLGRLLDDIPAVRVLHDRRAPRGRNIDHLVIAPTGVWVIDAKNYTGRVERRDLGRWLSTDHRLFVGGRDRTELIGGLDWQTDVVRTALRGCDEARIRPVVCFTDSDWPLLAKHFELGGVLVTWPARLAKLICHPGPLTPTTVDLLAERLSAELPAYA